MRFLFSLLLLFLPLSAQSICGVQTLDEQVNQAAAIVEVNIRAIHARFVCGGRDYPRGDTDPWSGVDTLNVVSADVLTVWKGTPYVRDGRIQFIKRNFHCGDWFSTPGGHYILFLQQTESGLSLMHCADNGMNASSRHRVRKALAHQGLQQQTVAKGPWSASMQSGTPEP